MSVPYSSLPYPSITHRLALSWHIGLARVCCARNTHDSFSESTLATCGRRCWTPRGCCLVSTAVASRLVLPSALSHIYMQPMEIYIDDEAKLTLHGLTQNYVKLEEDQKNRKLFDLLDEIEFNQVR